MKVLLGRISSIIFLLFIAGGVTPFASAGTRILRIVTYNIDCDTGATTPVPGLISPAQGGTTTQGGVLEGIGEEVVSGDPAQPIDVLALEETTSNTTTVAPIVAGLNAYYNAPGMYAMSSYQAKESGNDPTVGNGPNAMVYNTLTLQLVASRAVDPPTGSLGSTTGELREVVCYEFAPANVTPNATNEFYVYVSHYKSSSSGVEATNEAERAGEATIIRNDEANNLPANSRAIYVGDYNIGGSDEASYQIMLATDAPNGIAQGQGIDVMNLTNNQNIDWTASSNLSVKTESSRSLHYRDDLQVMTTNIYYGTPGGLTYVPGTYHSFGNNGTVPYEKSVTNSSNTALTADLTTNALYAPLTASQLYLDLSNATDHLPVVADYTIGIPDPPVVNFNATPTNGNVSLRVTFTDASTTGSPITNYFWTFGDGDITNSTVTSVTHIYNNIGTYTVTEIATSAFGSGTNTQTNLITALPPPPIVSFSVTLTNGTAPLTVTFTDSSLGSITNRTFGFGDGSTAKLTGSTIAFTYTNAGVYSVTDTVSGPGGTTVLTKTNLLSVITPYQAWQLQYFGCTNCPQAQTNADFDGTGQNNLFKYVAGLNPTNPTSVFTFNVGLVTNHPSWKALVLNPVAGGHTYTPQFTTNLKTSPWQTLTTVTSVLNNNTRLTITDTNATMSQEFYRINITFP